jgi:hypothetical protein
MKNIMFSLVALLALLVIACTPIQQAEEPAPPAPAVQDATNNVVDDNMEKQKPTEVNSGMEGGSTPTGAAIAVGGDVDVLSQPACSNDGKVTVVVTNNEDVAWDVDELDFRLNVAPDATPDCDKSVLDPGESMVCRGLDSVTLTGRRAIIQLFTAGRNSYDLRVTCP